MTPNLMQVKCAARAACIELHACSNYGGKIEAIIYDGVRPTVVWQPWLDKYQAMDLAQRVGLDVSWENDQYITVGKSVVFTDADKAMSYIVSHAAAQTPAAYQPVNVENPVRYSSEPSSSETTREVPVPKVLSTQELAVKYGFQYVQIQDPSGMVKYKVEHCIKGRIYYKEYLNVADAHMDIIKLIKEKKMQPVINEVVTKPANLRSDLPTKELAKKYGFSYVCGYNGTHEPTYYVVLEKDPNAFNKDFPTEEDARNAMLRFIEDNYLPCCPSAESYVMCYIQDSLMLFDPATGEEKPYPSSAVQWRNYHGKAAWLYNPWTGKLRDARDIGSDVFGFLIV